MKRVLVTGGTGFVGNHLVRRLLRDGHTVDLLVRAGHAEWRIADLRGQVGLHPVAIESPTEVADLFRHLRPEWVFHLAAFGAYSWQTDRLTMNATNVVGTVNLLDAAVATGCEAFVHAGSSSEYGIKRQPPAETEWLDPNSDYAVTKACATHFCRQTARRSGAHIVTLRLYSVYGPYEDPRRLWPTLVRHGLRGALPPLVDPTVARDYVFADDVDEAFVLAASVAGQESGAIYNVGAGKQTSLAELVELARRALPIAAKPRWGSMPNRSWDTATWVADPSRIQAALGWQPKVDLEAGLRAMIAFFRERPELAAYYDHVQARGG